MSWPNIDKINLCSDIYDVVLICKKLTTVLNSESLGIDEDDADSTLALRSLIFLVRSSRF